MAPVYSEIYMGRFSLNMKTEVSDLPKHAAPERRAEYACAFNLTDIKNVSIRVAAIGDAKKQGALGWLHFVAPNQETCTVSESYVADITGARKEYDILVAVGPDMRRLQRLLRLYQPALTKKPKIAVLIGGMPSDRSKLLISGYDDVFDQRMPAPEVQARLLAHYRRYRIASGRAAARGQQHMDVSQWCAAPLTAREQEILACLIERAPEAVRTYHLRKSQSGKRELANSSLRVLISTIRSKLMAGITIRYAGSSYALELSGQ